MKKLLPIFLLVTMPAMGADLTIPTSTVNNQIYNQQIRDTKDGNNALTGDSVTADAYSQFTATTTVKSSGGYLDNITISNLLATGCETYPIKVYDNTAASGTLIVQVSTAATIQNPVNVPLHVRFSTGLSVGVSGTCTSAPSITVSYR